MTLIDMCREFRETLNVNSLLLRMERSQLRWFTHVTRLSQTRLVDHPSGRGVSSPIRHSCRSVHISIVFKGCCPWDRPARKTKCESDWLHL